MKPVTRTTIDKLKAANTVAVDQNDKSRQALVQTPEGKFFLVTDNVSAKRKQPGANGSVMSSRVNAENESRTRIVSKIVAMSESEASEWCSDTQFLKAKQDQVID